MKHFFTISLCFLALSLSAQTDGWEYPFPYNPDGNADGYIALDDLMDFLALYGQEYPDSFYSDSTRSVLNLGVMGVPECSKYAELFGNDWRVISHKDIPFFTELIVNSLPEPHNDAYGNLVTKSQIFVDIKEGRGYQPHFDLDAITNLNNFNPDTYYLNQNTGIYYYGIINHRSYLNFARDWHTCILVSEVRPEYEYTYCNAQGGQDEIFKDCIESKLNEGWIPWQGGAHNYHPQYQGFWRIKD